MSSFFAMLFTVMMVAYSASSLSLSIGAGKNAMAVPTLFVTIYFVFMLVSANCVFLRETFFPVFLRRDGICLINQYLGHEATC